MIEVRRPPVEQGLLQLGLPSLIDKGLRLLAWAGWLSRHWLRLRLISVCEEILVDELDERLGHVKEVPASAVELAVVVAAKNDFRQRSKVTIHDLDSLPFLFLDRQPHVSQHWNGE